MDEQIVQSLGHTDTHQHVKHQEHAAALVGVHQIAGWFAALTGFIYATGFLVVLTYSDFIGAREATTEFFRAKFFHVGLLCLLLPTILIGAVYSVIDLKIVRRPSQPTTLHPSSMILLFNLILAIYTFLMFAPPGYLKAQPYLILNIFGATIFGILGIIGLGKYVVRHARHKYEMGSRWILCAIIVFGLDYHCFNGMWDRIHDIYLCRGLTFVLFLGMMTFTAWRLKLRMAELDRGKAKTALWVMGCCVLGPMYFLSVISFAYTIYPNIPASRGGGDFAEAPYVVLHYREASADRIPKEISQGRFSQPLVLIEEAEKWLVVADPHDSAGPPEMWRQGGVRPQVYCVNRDDVISFVYQSRRENHSQLEASVANGAQLTPNDDP